MDLAQARIPAVGHFVWLGPQLSPVAWLATRAALDRAGLDRVILHATDAEVAEDPGVQALATHPDFQLRLIDQATVFEAAPIGDLQVAEVARLREVYDRLEMPTSRSNLLRLLVLIREGGVYLDSDAIAMRDLRPLLDQPGFGGLEHVCLPVRVRDSHNPLVWARAGALMGLREVFARLPGGERGFARVSGLYDSACNNAILGAAPGLPFLSRCLREAAQMPDERAMRRFELGPKLLERVTGNRDAPGFRLYPPAAFYPYAPEICWHLFRPDPHADLQRAFGPETWVVHLYDSVVKRRHHRPIDRAWLRETRGRNLFSQMVAPYVDELLALA